MILVLPVGRTSYQRLTSHIQQVKPLLQKPHHVLLQPPFPVNPQDPEMGKKEEIFQFHTPLI